MANKPGVDWPQIQREYEVGDSAYEIAKRHPVSKQAILQRKTKEGWEGLPAFDLVDMDELDRQVRSLPSVVDNEEYNGLRTAENAKQIILDRAGGLSLTGCVKRCGVSDTNKLQNWRETDEYFNALLSKAEGDFEHEHWGHLTKASKRGDVGATKTTLEKSDATKHYQTQEKSQGITVIFNNVPKPGMVIDHE